MRTYIYHQRFSLVIVYRLHGGTQCVIGKKLIASVEDSLRVVVIERPKVGVTKQNQIEMVFEAGHRCSI